MPRPCTNAGGHIDDSSGAAPSGSGRVGAELIPIFDPLGVILGHINSGIILFVVDFMALKIT
ncbi:MAG: hypothetical protein C0424_00500 [Sphingobacteriaceae bacterium]|nr:hypothetical protein [Sphingobacteriaceae bacterium]